MKFNYLTKHASYHLWSYPRQDNQSIQLPKRLTPFGGKRRSIQIQYINYALPDRESRFHVYQVGGLNPYYLNLFPRRDSWISVGEMMKENNVIFDVYTNDGIMLPRYDVYYCFTDRRNLLFAIRENRAIPYDFNKDNVYFRTYQNAHFHVLRNGHFKDYIDYLGSTISTKEKLEELIDFKDKYNGFIGLSIYLNGFRVSDVGRTELNLGDSLEMVFDTTVYRKIRFRVDRLDTFDSILDLKKKYLLHYQGGGIKDRFDYHDDIDFYVSRKSNYLYKGVYYHRNFGDAVRNVTNRDYSLIVPYLRGYLNHNSNLPAYLHKDERRRLFNGLDDVYIEMFVRRGMLDREYVYNAHKLHELYKLEPYDISRAFLGIDSLVPEWRADVLELSPLLRVIASKDVPYDLDLVKGAYGYHAISRLVGYTPTSSKDFKVEGNHTLVEVPYNLTNYSTYYEYDSEGVLTGSKLHWYTCYQELKYSTTKMVEAISGIRKDSIDNVYTTKEFTIPKDVEFRLYQCPKGSELIPVEWKDVTEDESLFVVDSSKEESNEITLVDSSDNFTYLFRTDKEFMGYSLGKKLDNGIIDFILSERAVYNGKTVRMRMTVPRGVLDVYLNGHALVQGIDYFIQFPRIVICTKEYFNNVHSEEQIITIRFHGFCTEKLEMQPIEQRGYIQHNTLSFNKYFNLTEDEVLTITIGGAKYDREVLGFSEDLTKIRLQKSLEGKPYEIKDIIVPLRSFGQDTYQQRLKSIQTKERIEQYLTLKKPEEEITTNEVIPSLYRLYSPFLSYLTDDILKQTLHFKKLNEAYGDQDLMDFLKNYEWLLEFDPCYNTKYIDFNYVIIHPFPVDYVISVTRNEYRFLENVIRLYLKNRVKLSHFVTIT